MHEMHISNHGFPHFYLLTMYSENVPRFQSCLKNTIKRPGHFSKLSGFATASLITKKCNFLVRYDASFPSKLF